MTTQPSTATQPSQKTVMQLLRDADETIDRLAGIHDKSTSIPKIERNDLSYHIIALAGILRRTSADMITGTCGSIIVEVKRSRREKLCP